MRLTQPQIRRAVEKFGGELKLDECGFTLYAPPGYVWAGTATASVCAATEEFGERIMGAALESLTMDIRNGLRKCTPDESADLEHLMDEPWTASDDAPEAIDWPTLRAAAAI